MQHTAMHTTTITAATAMSTATEKDEESPREDRATGTGVAESSAVERSASVVDVEEAEVEEVV